MKKLMTMIAAAAMSFGLFADGVISNRTEFASLPDGSLDITLNDDGGHEGTVYWSYSADAIGDGEATIASNELVLKTGNKVLTRNFTGLPYAQGGDFPKTKIPEGLENGLFLDTQVKFGAPCDEIATDLGDAKFAAFFVDETEIDGWPNDFVKGTNLWVVGSDDEGPAAFRMTVLDGVGNDVTIGKSWLDAAKRVAVKAYASATTDGLPGFIIYIGENFAKVNGKLSIANNAVTPAEFVKIADGAKYLGDAVTVTRRYADNQLVLSMAEVADGKLQGAAFRGMGTVDSIYVGEVAPADIDFTEVQFMDVELNGVTIAVTGGTLNKDGKIEGKDGEEIVVVATSSDPTKECFTFTGVDGVQNPGNTFTFEFKNAQKLTVTAIKAGAYMNGTAYATFKDAYDAALKLDTVVALTLNAAAAYPDEEGMTIAAGKVWTIDLNGQALTFNLAVGLWSCIENAGTLTITNSGAVATGKINNIAEGPAALISNADGTVAIQAGIFDGALFGEDAEGTYTISGGSFLKEPNTVTDEETSKEKFKYEVVEGKAANDDDNYWTVIDEPVIEYVTFTVTYDAEEVENVTVTTNNGVADIAVELIDAKYTVESNALVTVAAKAKAGYENVAISGNNVTVDQDGKFTASEAVSVITISATEIAVTEITLDKSSVSIYVGGTSNVVATIAPAQALVQTVEWDYSDLNEFATAQVEGNTLKITGTVAQPVSSSPMVIKAKVGAVEAACNVFVIPVPTAGPTTDTPNAKVEEQDLPGGKVAVVTTTDSNVKAVTLSGLGATTTVQVDGQIDSITGVGAGNQITVKSRGGTAYDITEFCTITLEGDTATIALDPAKAKPVIGEVMVDDEPVAPVSADGTVGFATKPGLYYTLIAGNEPGAVTVPATESTLATGTAMKLTADPAKFTPTGAKAFFKVDAAK